jgi:hypothetical protein
VPWCNVPGLWYIPGTLYCAGGGISFATERPVAGEARTALTCAVRCSVGSVLIQVAAASFFMTLYVVCLY